MLDGRHTGTGGGNHFVLGGATPADIPFLRRPDLLREPDRLLAQPSLAVLPVLGAVHRSDLAGAARGRGAQRRRCTSSKSPAADAAPGRRGPPWLMDRLLRNLLIDVTGNTHRAEFCIDKLYSPDGPTGRLGLLELRAFEMPPHARMSLTQQLLLRSLVARFWQEPYRRARLMRWGTELHDRFMLPYFVEQDFRDVLAEQRAAGYALGSVVVCAALRVPLSALRRVSRDGRRNGAAPGARALACDGRGRHAAGGTVRYVDSSVERLQVKVTGLAPDRYAVTCNGRRVPLRPTGTAGRIRCRGALSRLAAARGSASAHPRALAADVRPGRHLDAPLTRAAASITSPIRAGAATAPFRSIHSRPRAGDWRASSASAIPAPASPAQPGLALERQSPPIPISPLRWICVAPAEGSGHRYDLRMMADNTQLLYPGSTQRYDELLERDGTVRQHWRPLIDHLALGGADAARRCVEMTRRLVIENGVTYNVYADAQGRDRPWQLDPLPLLIDAKEWAEIEAGVQQRAQLLNALLADLYGPQFLIAEGIVPAELAFGHPNFLWSVHGTRPLGDHLAASVCRRPRARAGWALVGAQRSYADAFGSRLRAREPRHHRARAARSGQRDGRAAADRILQRAAPEHHAGRGGWRGAAGRGADTRSVQRDLFRARLPCPADGIAAGAGAGPDRAADTVYLKTLGGLRRVHAILRRLDDDYCDPLELRADSALGVPGLLGAVRAGRLTVANALGSGVLESAAWLGFLPGAAGLLLGETLRLPSVATWWCGERPALDYAIAHLDRLVVKPTFPNQKFEPRFGRNLDEDERALLIARLRSRPYAYVAQERIALSQAPSWRAGATCV